MRPSLALNTHREAIRTIALRHRVTNVRVFGSVVHGDDTDGSDLDLLVEPTSETHDDGHCQDSAGAFTVASGSG